MASFCFPCQPVASSVNGADPFAVSNAGIPADSIAAVWLDKQDMMIKYHISGRTLQKWRTTGILPFSKVFGKIYYNQSDVQQFLLQQKRR